MLQVAMTPDPQNGDSVPGGDNTMRAAPTALTISAADWQRLLDHLRSALPAEGCGLLACPERAEGDVTITHVFPGANSTHSPSRFRMAEADLIEAFRSMREHGLRLAAIFHSHPSSPPTLTAIDVEEAHYPEAAIVIVSFATHPPSAAGWRIERHHGSRAVTPVPIHVQPA